MSQPLLEGQIVSEEYTELRDKIRGLEESLARQAKDAKELSSLVMNFLSSMRAVFNGKQAAGDGETVSVTSPDKWNAWKARLGGRHAEFIDLLVISDGMTITQLSAAAKCHYNTALSTIQKMKSVGIVNLSGGRYSLR